MKTKMSKRIFSLVMYAFMVMLLISPMSIRAHAVDTWIGDGSLENPYEISNYKQLVKFANIINGRNGEIENLSACAKLTADIVANDGTFAEDGTFNHSSGAYVEPNKWTPIGLHRNRYMGVFDGQGKKISGLYVNSPYGNLIGLFGLTGKGSVVKNVILEKGYMCGKSIGGVCGENMGTIENCINSVDIIGKVIAGGVCCVNNRNGTIIGCQNAGKIRGENIVGGVCGVNGSVSRIINCINNGEVIGVENIGGICGLNGNRFKCLKECVITGCQNKGNVIGNSFVGGVTGCNGDASIVEDCQNAVSVVGDAFVGGISGRNLGTIRKCTNDGDVNGENCIGGVTGSNKFKCEIIDCQNNGRINGEFVSEE